MVDVGVRPQSQGPADLLHGTRLVPLLMEEHAQQVQGLGVLRLARDDALVQLGGQAQLSRSVLLDRGSQDVLHAAWLSLTKGPIRSVIPRSAAPTVVPVVCITSCS